MSDYPFVSGPEADSDPALAGLLEQLQQRHNGAICATLLYGSCLRSGDLYDGLLDLYLICDSYSAAYGHSVLATGNWVLPPNVFYAEQNHDGRTLRSKVTVISLRDFRRGSSTSTFESYIWGRFAQPTLILYARNESVRRDVENCLLQAVRTLLHNAVPALPEAGSVSTLWTSALALSYATELRTERSGRATELSHHAQDFYTALTLSQAKSLGFDFTLSDINGELHYKSRISTFKRRKAGIAWFARRVQGKMFSIMRLVKALFTFEGGLDYIAWKLERHSGEVVVIPDKVRRAPLIHMWGFFWGLYKRGIFK
ncbi:MAG: hypothetical protein ABJ013_13200 [Halioglobus sp.]